MMQDENNEYSSYLPSDENKKEESLPVTPSPSSFEQRDQSQLIWVAQKVNEVRQEIRKYVIGQSEMVEL